MIVFPAIDLRQGQVVRLRQGDPAAQTTYSSDPAEVARRWAGEGAEWLHVVNLDGAFGETAELPLNLRRLAEICAATGVPVQFGGGLRSLAAIRRVLEIGATRAVLGTAAVRNPALVTQALAEFGPERIVIGIDARDGLVAIQGWQETSALLAGDLARRMAGLGASWAVYTDIARDGMLEGVNVASTADLAQASGLQVIASGGVAGVGDVERLAAYQATGIAGVIIGQALYAGKIDLPAALAAARTRGPAALDTFIRAAGIAAELVPMYVETPTVPAAAAALGVEPAQIVKSLLFQVRNEPVLVIASGAMLVDRRALAAHYGVGKKQIKLADPLTVLRVTGYPVGGVPPFGYPRLVPVFLDRAIAALDVVYGGGGDHRTLLRVAVPELERVVQGTWLALSASKES
jgi:phosphoribosylformimino-5-aminoimidazole carboxamide ribotide isomerase